VDLEGTGSYGLIDPDALNLNQEPAALQVVMAGTQAIQQPTQITAPAPVLQNPPAPAVLQATMAAPLILKGGGSSITRIEETLKNKKNN